VAINDHTGGRRLEFLEMLGLPMRIQRGRVVIDLVEEDVIWIVGQHRDVEFAAARFLDGVGGVFLDRLQEFRHLGRNDDEVDRVDVDAARLCGGITARQKRGKRRTGEQRERGSGYQGYLAHGTFLRKADEIFTVRCAALYAVSHNWSSGTRQSPIFVWQNAYFHRLRQGLFRISG